MALPQRITWNSMKVFPLYQQIPWATFYRLSAVIITRIHRGKCMWGKDRCPTANLYTSQEQWRATLQRSRPNRRFGMNLYHRTMNLSDRPLFRESEFPETCVTLEYEPMLHHLTPLDKLRIRSARVPRTPQSPIPNCNASSPP
jgi:hypothetical protein